MWMIVGLGNPGECYRFTPHNLGFLVVDHLAGRERIRVTRPEGGALVGPGVVAGQDVLLVKPLSYMNLSGGPTAALARKYGVEPGRCLIVYDELALPWGTTRLKMKGSAGGHRGMESVIAALKTSEVPRLRLGIGQDAPIGDGAKYVLRPLRRDELESLNEVLASATDVVRLLLSDGAEKAMAAANRRAEGLRNEEA